MLDQCDTLTFIQHLKLVEFAKLQTWVLQCCNECKHDIDQMFSFMVVVVVVFLNNGGT